MPTPGIEFEILVKSIYDEILEQESIENIEVHHNAKIQGLTGQEHQIDIFWSFRVGGVLHRVAVECKDYARAVSVGRIRDFSAALDDIGSISGIFVTRKGFQAGAVQFASKKGISLKTVDDPTDADIKEHGGVSSVNIRAHALTIEKVKEQFCFDLDWIFANTDLKQNDAIEISGLSNEIRIEDEKGVLIGTMFDFTNQLPRTPLDSVNLKHELKFDNAYIVAPICKYPKLKIKSILFQYDTLTHISESRINYKIMAKKILKDYITGEAYLFKRTMHPK